MDEQALISQYLKGDMKALEEIYHLYKTTMFTVACCMLKSHEKAEDCVHDVFVKFTGQAGQIKIKSNLKSYLVSSVANRARDMMRKRTPDSDASEWIELEEASEAGPLLKLLKFEETQEVYQALMHCQLDQREVITLRLHGGLTFKQIAKECGISTSTAKSRYRYGLEKLRNHLSSEATS